MPISNRLDLPSVAASLAAREFPVLAPPLLLVLLLALL
jgi:hypothetical protein